MLVNTIETANDLRNEFIKYDRDQFSYEAYEVIVDYFNEFEGSIELDVIGICCDFNEDTFEEFINNYDVEVNEGETLKEAVINYMDTYGGFYQITLEDKIVYVVL